MPELRAMTKDEIRKTVREYLLREFLPGVEGQELSDATPLITGGILDSVATTRLVVHLEELYGIEFRSDDVTIEHLNTVEDIVRFVHGRL